jgi:benzodiazapine receptor
MNTEIKKYFSLVIWIAVLILIGWWMGLITQNQVNTWYSLLHRSSLTPPNYVFGIVWTILYAMIGLSGWLIWCQRSFPGLQQIKNLYLILLLLNWSWTPLFFYYHLTGYALAVLVLMDIGVSSMIYLSYTRLKLVAQLMVPYLLWILLATYLNFYIWYHN